MLQIIAGIIISYLIGSIPTAYIFGRILKGVDIRDFGSGNVGATNAMRVLGKKAGITVLILDILKGVIAVVVLGDILSKITRGISTETISVLLGIGCICGHNWTVFLKFKGGKGVATSLGVLIGLSVKIAGFKSVMAFVLLTWLFVFVITKIVSLASVLTAISIPIFMSIFKQSNIIISSGVLLCVFILLRHKTNLKRLLEGKEPRFNFRRS